MIFFKKIQKNISAIWTKTKQHLSSQVSGQFKNRQTLDCDIVKCFFYVYIRPVHFIDEHAEWSSKRAKEKTMTYIISGISDGKPFLMSDCVLTENTKEGKKFKYGNKLNRLISTEKETYYCLAGSDSYTYAIDLFDTQCYEKKLLLILKTMNTCLKY